MLRVIWALAGLGFVLWLGNALAQQSPMFEGCKLLDNKLGAPPAACSQPRFYTQYVEILVPKTGAVVDTPNPTCNGNNGANTLDWAKQIANAAKAYSTGDLSQMSGNLLAFAQNTVIKNAIEHTGGDLHNMLLRNFGERTDKGNCGQLAAVIPGKAQILGVRIGAWDDVVGMKPCAAGFDCAIGYSRFTYSPMAQGGDNPPTIILVTTNFMNWSHDRDRVARMIVFYTLPADAPAPIPII